MKSEHPALPQRHDGVLLDEMTGLPTASVRDLCPDSVAVVVEVDEEALASAHIEDADRAPPRRWELLRSTVYWRDCPTNLHSVSSVPLVGCSWIYILA